jgi:Tfp pilus assembly protein PilZ
MIRADRVSADGGKGSAMDERRRFERMTQVFPAEVYSRQSGKIVGLVADVSSGGLLLRTETPQSPGEDLELTLELPAGKQVTREFELVARVRWCEPDIAPGTYVLGLAFTGRTAPDGPVAMDLVRALKDAS